MMETAPLTSSSAESPLVRPLTTRIIVAGLLAMLFVGALIGLVSMLLHR